MQRDQRILVEQNAKLALGVAQYAMFLRRERGS
jgi:ABC-type branched-subunit amino acid transport system ATPase component